MAKIAVELEQALKRRALSGAPGNTVARRLAEGNGWTVSDVVCTSGPQDRPFEERHSGFSIAIVAAGSFQYRSAAGRELMSRVRFCSATRVNASNAAMNTARVTVASRLDTPQIISRGSAKPDFRMLRLPPLRALPHKYVLRARLREAAMRLAAEPARVLDVALDCRFGDVSNFNHAFRAEFGVSPRVYRLESGFRD